MFKRPRQALPRDLPVVRQISDQVLAMRAGRVVERGSTSAILDHPEHPYTKLLRASVPGPGWRPRRRAPMADAAEADALAR